MAKQYQVTLISNKGYKPVSTIVTRKDEKTSTELKTAGIKKIAQKRLWTNADLKNYGYTTCKIREYDKEKIEQENKERYERIKEEKYASGEWKRPVKSAGSR